MNEVIISSEQSGTQRLILPAGEYVVGRDHDVSLHIDDPSISRQHARLTLGEKQIWLEDLGSENGSFVGELLVEGMARMETGQTARFGNVSLCVRRVSPNDSLTSAKSYLKGDVLARGGMGAIHEARQTSMCRDVAMKVMLREGDDQAIQRFIHEARVTGRLEHPNIVPVHEIGTDDSGRVFYTMKLVKGTTLSHALAELSSKASTPSARHSLASLLTVFQKVCDAIAFAHSLGVIHRDLKPDNIMLGDFGEVLVMDWGLAKDTSADDDPTSDLGGVPLGGAGSTLDGSVMGTPAYMSPEQARGEIRQMDVRSDIYALGAILHEILYLRPVVSGGTAMEIVAKVARGERDRIGTFSSKHLPSGKVPASLRAVRRKALAFDPSDRYQEVRELQADISAYQSGFATGAEGAGLATHAALFVKRHKGVSRSVAAASIALAGLTIWFTAHLVKERNRADKARIQAEAALALVEPARVEANAQRDKATAALGEAESQRELAANERDRAVKALAQTQAIRQRATDALKEMQNAGEIFSKLSAEYVRSGRVDEALEHMDRALEVAPQNTQYRVARANLLQACGRFSQAIPEYRRVLSQRRDPQVEKNLALSEKLAREKGEAKELTESIRKQLEEALKSQNRALEAILLDPETAPEVESATIAGETPPPNDPPPSPGLEANATVDRLIAKLGAFTSQPGWSAERVKVLPGNRISLDLRNLTVSSLAMLRDTQVTDLSLYDAKISSLDSLRGVPLLKLSLRGTGISDISALSGMPLENLECEPRTSDLSPLKGMPLKSLWLWASQAKDLSPLRGMPLTSLVIDHVNITSLEDLRGMPLTRLHANSKNITDFSAIQNLTELSSLSLPPHAHGIDFSKLTQLREVSHTRFKPSGWMPAKEFIRLSQLSDVAWEKWREQLASSEAEDLRPDRLTVLKPIGFDLDLRKTKITSLKALAGMPIHRLYLDTSHVELDLSPLANMPTLRHLVLPDAYVKSLRTCFPGSQLESIVLCPDILATDVSLLSKHPTLTHVGYVFDPNTLLPATSRKEFYHPRIDSKEEVLPAEIKPLVSCRFDDFSSEANGWTIVTDDGWSSPSAWTLDPPKLEGRGGGYLSFIEREREGKTSYYNAPASFLGDKRTIFGGCFEFQIRQKHRGEYFEEPDMILAAGALKLVHSFKCPPGPQWRTYVIPLDPSGDWHVGDPNGPSATEEDFKEVLAKLDGVRIRAEFRSGANETSDFDDLRVWSTKDTPIRIKWAAEKEQRFLDSIAWGKSTKIISSDTRVIAEHYGYQHVQIESNTWLESYANRDGLLLVHPVDQETPAKISFKVESPVAEGSRLKFSAHGSTTEPGVKVRVLHHGKPLAEAEVNNAWKDFEVKLPASPNENTTFDIEVVPDGWSWEFCFIDEISVVSPVDSAPGPDP